MKKLKMNNIRHPQKGSVYTRDSYYWVNLGNGVSKNFKAKADAVKFLNEVAKNLTYKMHECNELYISAFNYYRRAWFYFDHDKVTTQHNLADWYRKERECEDALVTVTTAFNLLFKRSNWTDGNHFVFVHFYTILSALDKIIANVKTIYENKSVAGTQYELEILTRKIGYCRRTIENYSIELENNFTEVEKVELTIAHSA